jgi:hypothetical protein
MWGIALFSLAAGIVRLITFGFNKISIVLLIFGIGILTSRWLSRRVLARMFAKLPNRNAKVCWQIYPDRLVIETPTSKTETAWSQITNIVRTDHGFLIYPQPGIFYWLPFHSFSAAIDVEHFERLSATRQRDG